MQVITDAIMLDEDGAWALMPNPCGSPVTPGCLSPGPPGLHTPCCTAVRRQRLTPHMLVTPQGIFTSDKASGKEGAE